MTQKAKMRKAAAPTQASTAMSQTVVLPLLLSALGKIGVVVFKEDSGLVSPVTFMTGRTSRTTGVDEVISGGMVVIAIGMKVRLLRSLQS